MIGVNLVNFGKVLCFTYHDGSVEYRDRFTMDELYREPNLDRINSVLDAGFSQSGDQSCVFHLERPCFYAKYLTNSGLGLQMALSPTNFSLVQICEDGQVKWHSINYTLSDLESMTDGMCPSAPITHLEISFDGLTRLQLKFLRSLPALRYRLRRQPP